MAKLKDIDLLKYWADSEFSIIHIWAAMIMYQLVEASWQHIALGIYIVFNVLYGIVRISYVVQQDPDYLRVPKRK